MSSGIESYVLGWIAPIVVIAIICYYLGKHIGHTTNPDSKGTLYLLAPIVWICGGYFVMFLLNLPTIFPGLAVSLFVFLGAYLMGTEKGFEDRGIYNP